MLEKLMNHGVEVTIEEGELNSVELQHGLQHVQVSSNRDLEEVKDQALYLFVRGLMEQTHITCKKCDQVFKSDERYNRLIGKSTII